jgi:hypothetical protein
MCSAILGENSSIFYVCGMGNYLPSQAFLPLSFAPPSTQITALMMMLRSKVILKAEVLKKKKALIYNKHFQNFRCQGNLVHRI